MEDAMKIKDKNSLLKKMLVSLTFTKGSRARFSPTNILSKSKSCHSATSNNVTRTFSEDDQKRKTKRQVTPDGCFAVCVGPEKQKFVIKIEYANHPLFKMLLEDAELEYGFTIEGPILLPCDVDLFCKVLAEMDSGKEIDYGCGFAYGSCSPFNPSRRLGKNTCMAKGHGSYGALTPSRLMKMNHF